LQNRPWKLNVWRPACVLLSVKVVEINCSNKAVLPAFGTLLISSALALSASANPAVNSESAADASPAASRNRQLPASINSARSVLQTIVVTANKESQRSLDVAYRTETVSEEQMLQNSARTVPEALDNLPGVAVQKTAHGHGSPIIRGFIGRQNLLMLDGIRLNNPVWRSGPNQYANTIDALAVERMELIAGQGSVLYGSDAIGGTLNVFLQQSNFKDYTAGENFQHGSALYRVDSNSWSSQAHVSQSIGVGNKWGLQLGTSLKDFNDIRDSKVGEMQRTGYPEQDWNLRFDYMLNADTQLTFASMGVVQDDVWRSHTTVWFDQWGDLRPVSAPQLRRTYDQFNNINYLRLSGALQSELVQNYTATLYHKYFDELEYLLTPKPNLAAPTRKEHRMDQTTVNTVGVNLDFTSKLKYGSLLWGGDYSRDWVDSSRITRTHTIASGSNSVVNGLQGVVADNSTYDMLGLYAQHNLAPDSSKWEFNNGARYTYARAGLGKLDVGGKASSLDRSWDDWVLSSRVLYKIKPQWSVYAGISQAFRAPNIDDLSAFQKVAQSNNIVNGNANLDSEQFLSYEVGTKYQGKKLALQLSGYYTRINDMIVQKLFVNGNKLSSVSANGGEGWVAGVELSASYQLHEDWSLHGMFGTLDGRLDQYRQTGSNSFVVSEDVLGKMPPLRGSLGLRWTSPGKRYWIEGRITAADDADQLNISDQNDTSRIPVGGTPGYYVVSLYGGYNINESWSVNLALENLTDQSYRLHGSGVNETGINTIATIKYVW